MENIINNVFGNDEIGRNLDLDESMLQVNEACINTKAYWESHNVYRTRDKIKSDNWLDTFLQEIDNCKTPIIDLGCGSGNNTLTLLNKGKTVIPCDFSKNAIKNIHLNFPELERVEQFDLLNGLPFENDFTDIIIADLCLHYFTIKQTEYILNDIMRVLKSGGILLARINSIQDVNYGAGKGKEIERHLYITEDRRYKRFFDEDDIWNIFGKHNIEYMKENTMNRYLSEKILWSLKIRFFKEN